ncbi:MAG: hypothetical protein KGJ84_16080 [Elusimicrobia bacterium]|nr:hypothetical protein [Elusimicrobiota bacterium]
MSGEGPQLALLARIHEAATWNDAVRRHESDPWAYMRRKLHDTEGPLRAYKSDVFERAKEKLFADLSRPLMPPGGLEAHREAFEALLPAGDFADLSFHLSPAADRQARLEGARSVLGAAKAPTLFDHEALPPEKRSRTWEKRVVEMTKRLGLEEPIRVAERGLDPARRARVARRLRRNLREYLSVALHEGGLRDEITPFMLARLEAAVAAVLRPLERWR